MSLRTYPSLSPMLDMQLEAVRVALETDPAYLLVDECPYSEGVKAALRTLVAPARGQNGGSDVFQHGQSDDEQADSLILEVQSAINAMKRLQSEMDRDGVDTSDKLTFFKNYGGMMERLLSLKEKAHGAKQMYEFQRIVITTLEQVLDKDQVLDFKNKLKTANLSVSI